MMGATKRLYEQTIPITTTGSASTFAVAYPVTPGALYDGSTHLIQWHAANAASATLDINSLGAKPLHVLKPAGWGVIPASTVVANMVCRVTYHETSGAYRLIEGPTSAVLTSATDGYTVGPSGLRRQWGQITATNTSNTVVNFPVAYSSTPYVINLTPASPTGVVTVNMPWVLSASTTGFLISNTGTAMAATTFLWSAEGPA
jgi:hypothetical protein